MGKPPVEVYKKFVHAYENMNAKIGKEQYLVPYLMSSHPGSGLKEAVELAEFLRDMGYTPQQVQDFYPTPSTISTCMYYTGLDPRTMEPVFVSVNPHEKAMQRALIQYRNPKNYDLVREALVKAGRTDLIGDDKKCLIGARNYAKLREEQRNKDKRKQKAGSINKNERKRKEEQVIKGKRKHQEKQVSKGKRKHQEKQVSKGKHKGSGATIKAGQAYETNGNRGK